MLNRATARIKTLASRASRRAHPGAPASTDQTLLASASLEDRAIIQRALPYTMTGVARLQALIDAVRYVVQRDVSGSFAECGVWRGGSVLAMVLTLQELGIDDRDIYLFDTFEGMTAPTEHDVSAHDPPAIQTWEAAEGSNGRPWEELFDAEHFTEDAVRTVLHATGYPAEHLHFQRGPVEETLPRGVPAEIALLRLDTDWYESTRCELEYLYPALASPGVLLIDDYGHWDGCRRAVDEFFAAYPPSLLLQRIDYTGRIAIKA